MIKVLFVCLGNICRSPTAEGVFRNLVEREGLSDQIDIDSCGTGSFHRGEPPDRRAIEALAEHDIDISGLRARVIDSSDFEAFDIIVAMDNDNIQSLYADCPYEFEDRIKLFLSFAPYMGTREVPDPFYGGDQGFQNALIMIEKASEGLLEHIRQKHLS